MVHLSKNVASSDEVHHTILNVIIRILGVLLILTRPRRPILLYSFLSA